MSMNRSSEYWPFTTSRSGATVLEAVIVAIGLGGLPEACAVGVLLVLPPTTRKMVKAVMITTILMR